MEASLIVYVSHRFVTTDGYRLREFLNNPDGCDSTTRFNRLKDHSSGEIYLLVTLIPSALDDLRKIILCHIDDCARLEIFLHDTHVVGSGLYIDGYNRNHINIIRKWSFKDLASEQIVIQLYNGNNHAGVCKDEMGFAAAINQQL